MSEEFERACRSNDTVKIKSLVSKTPSLLASHESVRGYTGLHIATLSGHQEASRLLLSLGSDANAQSAVGETPLHQAVQDGRLSFCELLLEYSCNINVQNKNGDSALHLAVKTQRLPIISFLLENGADVNARNSQLRSPFDLATSRDVSELLLEYKERARMLHMLRTSDIENIPSITQDSISEREPVELSHKLKDLLDWLTVHKLEHIFKLLVNSGYDDLQQLIALIHSPEPLNEDVLVDIGIEPRGIRLRLLAALYAETPVQNNKCLLRCCPATTPRNSEVTTLPALEHWLARFGASRCFKLLAEAGFEEVEQLAALDGTPWMLNHDLLSSFGIDNHSDRQLILTKIKEDCGGTRKSFQRSEEILCCLL